MHQEVSEDFETLKEVTPEQLDQIYISYTITVGGDSKKNIIRDIIKYIPKHAENNEILLKNIKTMCYKMSRAIRLQDLNLLNAIIIF